MLFVNRIAHILHGIVVQCAGTANKNIGDAFLLTWKLDEDIQPGHNVNLPMSKSNTYKYARLADQALLSFCK